MGRPSRVLVDNGVYHVISRGHNRYRIFNCLEDYKAYKKIISHYKKRFTFDLFHYCLMPNHIHLLFRISIGSELPDIMQAITQAYSRYYKKRCGLIGNLFQGRYKGLYIEKDEYLMDCGRYIERNPLRANMVGDLSEYYFSSFRYYSKGREDSIVSASPLFDALSDDAKERMRLYSEYVLQERPYEKIIDKEFKI